MFVPISLPCTYCGAPAGVECTTRTGRRVTAGTHTARRQAAQARQEYADQVDAGQTVLETSVESVEDNETAPSHADVDGHGVPTPESSKDRTIFYLAAAYRNDDTYTWPEVYVDAIRATGWSGKRVEAALDRHLGRAPGGYDTWTTSVRHLLDMTLARRSYNRHVRDGGQASRERALSEYNRASVAYLEGVSPDNAARLEETQLVRMARAGDVVGVSKVLRDLQG